MLRCAGSGAALVAVLVLASCGSDSDSASDQPPVKTIEVTVTDDGCEPAAISADAGPTTFHVSNKGSGDDATEFEVIQDTTIFGEIENVEPGKDGSLSLTLQPGTYVTKCRGGTTDTGSLEVTGTATAAAADPAASATAVSAYLTYVADESKQLVAAVQPFADAVKAGDIEKAKSLFAAARYHYESIEPIAESFGDLDPEIDAREGDVPDAEWGGFHRIEKALWTDNTTDGMSPVADKLVADIAGLNAKIDDHRARTGTDRQRRRRAPQRGFRLEDHGRRGPLLAHRPVRLRSQPCRRAGRVRRRATTAGNQRCSPGRHDRHQVRRHLGSRSTPTRTRQGSPTATPPTTH